MRVHTVVPAAYEVCDCLVFQCPLATFACSASSSPAGGTEGGSSPTGAVGTTVSCLIQLKGFEAQCQFYEATGTGAARTLDQLRAECVDKAGATAKVLDACPIEKGLGGCKTPVTVKGVSDVKLFVTNFEYEPTVNAAFETHSTAEQVKSFCANQGASTTYVPAP